MLQDWRDIKKIQRHWIGECNGVNFDFKIKDSDSEFLTFWTNAPEFIEHVKFVAVSSDNILAKKENQGDTQETVKLRTCVVNPFNLDVIPVFMTNEIEFFDSTDSYLGKKAFLKSK